MYNLEGGGGGVLRIIRWGGGGGSKLQKAPGIKFGIFYIVYYIYSSRLIFDSFNNLEIAQVLGYIPE